MSTLNYRYKQNRFQQLRGFCYAAALGSISKAAARMYLTQPAVSQQIKGLETELNLSLFTRHGGRMQLNHDGELLYQMARPLIEELESLEDKFRQQRLEIDEGHIEVAAGLSTILYFLPRYIDSFRRAHPKIEIRLQQVTGIEGLERLRSGLVDFAVGPLMQIPSDIEFCPVVSYDPVVITCLEHPLAHVEKLTLQEIARYPLILPPRNLSTWPMIDQTFKRSGLSYHIAMEVGGWEAIKKYVELGLGISIIIRIGITGTEKLEVIPASEFFPRRAYGVVQLKGKILSPQAKRFVNLLIESAESPALSEPGKINSVIGPHSSLRESNGTSLPSLGSVSKPGGRR